MMMNKTMKWYKKQLEALKKNENKKTEPKKTTKPKKVKPANFASPVKQRNQNRPKTDLY